MTKKIVPQFIEVPANKRALASRRLIQGVGINDAHYFTQHKVNGKMTKCPFYWSWVHMIERCYDKKLHDRYPNYRDCTVSKEWLIFSNFKSWMEMQNWQGKDLDKDIILPGNKIYSPETCVFITSQVNSLLNNCGSRRGRHPQGVHFNKASNKFIAHCSVDGKKKYLGIFTMLEQAEKEYKRFKSDLIIKIANKQTDIRIKNGLLNHAKLISK